jgi:hypothetical protein
VKLHAGKAITAGTKAAADGIAEKSFRDAL